MIKQLIILILIIPVATATNLNIVYTNNNGKCGIHTGNKILINTNDRCDQEWTLRHEISHQIYSNYFTKSLQSFWCKINNYDYGITCEEYFANVR